MKFLAVMLLSVFATGCMDRSTCSYGNKIVKVNACDYDGDCYTIIEDGRAVYVEQYYGPVEGNTITVCLFLQRWEARK